MGAVRNAYVTAKNAVQAYADAAAAAMPDVPDIPDDLSVSGIAGATYQQAVADSAAALAALKGPDNRERTGNRLLSQNL